MNTNKIKEALAELQHEQAILGGVISQLQNIIATGNGSVSLKPSSTEKEQQTERSPSYIDHAVMVLELSGQPLHISVIAEKIADMRGKEVARASVESSIIRHISSLENRARIIKVKRAHFGLPSWKAIPQASSAA